MLLATNKIESLDPALLRPGRIDRKIEFPLPDAKTKRHIFKICTGKMTLAEDVNLEEFVMQKSELAGADIKAVNPKNQGKPEGWGRLLLALRKVSDALLLVYIVWGRSQQVFLMQHDTP